MGIGISVALILEAILYHSRSHILSWLGMRFEHGGTVGAFHHFVYAAGENAEGQRAKGIDAIKSITKLKEFLAGQELLLLLDLPFSLLTLSVIAYFSFQIALITLIVISVFGCMIWKMGRKLGKCLDRQIVTNKQRDAFIHETLNNYHTLKAFGMENLLLRSYERLHHDCAKANYQASLYSAKTQNLSNLLGYSLFIGCIPIAALQVINGVMTLGIMAALLILMNQIIGQIQIATRILISFQRFIIARKRVGEHFALPLNPPQMQGAAPPIYGKLAFENLYFQYAENKACLLKGIDLIIEPGSLITIHGKNGAGKTTLIELLMGNLHPTSGLVLVDDLPLSHHDSQNLRRQMAYVPPQGTLFQGTILENMTLYRNETHEEEAIKFSRQLGLAEWLSCLPLGHHTKIGDPLFLSLPEGIQQRICLVRAFVNHPKILILDEANICLDQEGDRLLREVLKTLHHQTTIIFITHQSTLQELADASYELKDGLLTLKSSLPVLEKKKIEPKILQMSQFAKPRKNLKTSHLEASPELYKIAGSRL
jgi:ATP-binding cassette subfamily C protein LapB